MTTLTFENVTTTYCGSDRKCRCGCSGSYADRDTLPKLAKRRFNEVMLQHSFFPLDVSEPFGGEVHMNLVRPNDRATTVYFKKGGKR